MGGGFMADNKDKTMQQQTTINTTAKQRKPQQLQQQQQELHPRHSHQALYASNPKPNNKLPPFLPSFLPSPAPSPAPPLKRKTPDPPTSTTTTTTTSSPPPTSLLSKQHKKKLLKVILKVPHSSPSPSSPSSSPLSRPSPRSPSYPPPHHHPHHHHHLSPASPSPSSPSPAPSPTLALPSPSHSHPLHRHKPHSETQQFHHLQQQRPSKPPLQQVKHPPLDSKQHSHKKSHQSSSQLQCKGHHGRPTSRLEHVTPNGEQAPPDLTNQQEDPIELQSKPGHTGALTNSNHRKCAERVDLAIPRIYRRTEQEEEASPRHARRADHIKQSEQVDLEDHSWSRQREQEDIANPSCSRQTEQGQDFNRSLFRGGEAADDTFAGHLWQVGERDLGHSCTQPAEEEDPHRSRPRRLEVQQLDEGAIVKWPERNHQQQEENHSTPYPKRLRSSHHQGHQELGRSELGTLKGQPYIKLAQTSPQQHPLKKLTQGSVQGPHGSHQNSKISPRTSSPNPVPPSTPASMQSSAPSLSTSAVSDEAQKPSKKRKLRSLLEPECTEGQSVVADSAEGQLQVNSAMPAATSAVDLPAIPSSPVEVLDSKEYTTANSSPKLTHQGPQLIPSKKLLNSILDRLQKKDKFGVFAEPVDSKEVPNYYDIIKDPMDFGTMRNRISSGYYSSVELFQRDIFLICDNAMQYNGKGTVYFRHARAIKDVAERILEDLKVSGLGMEMDEPTIKVKNGGSNRSMEKHDSFMNAGSPSEARIDNLDEVSGYLFKTSGSFDGRRLQAIDENRRNTYAPLATPSQGNDLLSTTISGDSLHLVPTGYQMDFPYSKSLARFAADLGPLVWKIAAEKIKKALPPGCPFGPGWVGERETGGGVLAPSTKQPMVGQSTAQQTAKLSCASGALAASGTGISSTIQAKLDSQSDTQGRHKQPNHDIVAKAECQQGQQAPTKLFNEIRSPMVFGNSLIQVERSEKLDQQVFGQSATQSMAENGKPQAHSQADKEGTEKFEQMGLAVGKKPKFAGQVNLNHPLSLQPDEGGGIDERVSNRDPVHCNKDKDIQEGKSSGPSVATIHVGNVGGGFPFEGSFNLGGAFNSRPPQTDRVIPVKAIMGELGTNTAARNQCDGRVTTQVSRFNPLNDSSSAKAGPIVTSAGKNDLIYQPDNFHMSRGPFIQHNLNMSLQQPSGISGVGIRDGNSFDPARTTTSLSQSVQGFTLQSNINTVVQQTVGSNQHSNSTNHSGSRDVSPQELGLPKLSAPPCQERALGERFKEAGGPREREMLSLAGRMTSGVASAASAVPRKGLIPERGFAIQQLEGRNGQASGSDLANAMVHNLDHLNRKQNAGAGLAASCSPSGLPNSNGASLVHEVPGWVPSQQPDSIQVTGKGGPKLHNQVLKSASECSEGTSGSSPLMRLQTTGIQDPQACSFGSKKHTSSMPHFLQQQLGSDNTHGLPTQHHPLQLHVQSNSLLPGSQNPSPSDSRESNFVRQFQLPSHLAFKQVGNPPWQYMSPQMVVHGSQQPFAAAPDLNVSLPLTKTSFDQPNGNEIQQPDLALQL